ncbi:MAG TPA: hypothetical protein VKF60_07335, partial [Myxococcota bacterium]|nr:hypothetical protein [Myxococcota bacterium]
MSLPTAEIVTASMRSSRRALLLPAAGAAVAAALAGVTLVGWQLELLLLRRVGWGAAQLLPVTALMLLALAGALASARAAILRSPERLWYGAIWICTAIALAPSLWTLLEGAIQLGVARELASLGDRVFAGAGAANPGASAAMTALSVICIGVSIGASALAGRHATLVRVAFGAFGVAIPFLALLAYADGAAVLHNSPALLANGMSLPTALGLVALGA